MTFKNGEVTMSPRTIALVLTFGMLTAAFGNVALAGCDDECCPPPPVKLELVAVDPCTECEYDVCTLIPACCADEAPCVTWRHGIFGRRVATYTWKSCDFSFDVVVNHRGNHWVR